MKGSAVGSALVALALMGLTIILAGCNAPGLTQETVSAAEETGLSGGLIVFAAASLTDAFDALGADFEARHPGVDIRFNFGGSQQLAQQIAFGAPADIFASANETQMEVVIETGRAVADQAVPFAGNQLAVAIPANNPGGIEVFSDLANPGIKLIVAAEEVPVGRYTQQFLEKANRSADLDPAFAENVTANVVSYEQSVRAVLSKISLGEADAGIVYSSDIVGQNDVQVRSFEIPPALNVVAAYPIALLTDSAQPALAAAFIDFIRSSEGQEILAEYGLLPEDGLDR